jgi:hypothetical protein
VPQPGLPVAGVGVVGAGLVVLVVVVWPGAPVWSWFLSPLPWPGRSGVVVGVGVVEVVPKVVVVFAGFDLVVLVVVVSVTGAGTTGALTAGAAAARAEAGGSAGGEGGGVDGCDGVVVAGGDDGVVEVGAVSTGGAAGGLLASTGGVRSCSPGPKAGRGASGGTDATAGETGAARTTVGKLGSAGPAGTMPTGSVCMPAGPARSRGKTAAPVTAPASRTAATSRSMALMLPVPFADDITQKGNRLRATGA